MLGPQTIQSLNAYSTHTRLLSVASLVKLWLDESCRTCWRNYVLDNIFEHCANPATPTRSLNLSVTLRRAVAKTSIGESEFK
ncbi:hypothetical protein RSAG8_00874, partial [Rhizoctonia solani AG-8 WAC10335]